MQRRLRHALNGSGPPRICGETSAVYTRPMAVLPHVARPTAGNLVSGRTRAMNYTTLVGRTAAKNPWTETKCSIPPWINVDDLGLPTWVRVAARDGRLIVEPPCPRHGVIARYDSRVRALLSIDGTA